jgi:hypothetical protein
LTIRRAIPPLPITVPAKINIGIASSVKESIPERIFCGTKMRKSGESITRAPIEAIPIAIAIGTEDNNATNRIKQTTIAIIDIP